MIRRRYGKYNHNELVKIVCDIITCVKAVHDRNFAHCDIKPANFLIDVYGRIKICDFVLSKILSDDHYSKIYSGTKVYMPPKIVNKRPHNPFIADVWSIGVTLYYLLTAEILL